MRNRWALPAVIILSFVGVCGGCLWSAFERPRFTHRFDIGGGRTLTVWSIRRDVLLDGDTDPNPLMIYYRVDAGDREVVHTTFLDHDDGGSYQFNMVSADGGRLACVYEKTRGADNDYLVLIYDARAQESWPRTWADEGGNLKQAAAKWRERYGVLQGEHPELPRPSLLVK